MSEIAAGVTGDATAWRDAGGAAMRSLDDSLRTMPATVQERWFARLFFVKPLAIGVLSIFWIATGLVTLARPEVAADVLATRGVRPTMAMTIALGGAVVDIAVGVGILVHRWLKAAAQGMIAVTLGYLIGGTWLAPDLWLDPLGALVKAVPAMVLAGVVLASVVVAVGGSVPGTVVTTRVASGTVAACSPPPRVATTTAAPTNSASAPTPAAPSRSRWRRRTERTAAAPSAGAGRRSASPAARAARSKGSEEG